MRRDYGGHPAVSGSIPSPRLYTSVDVRKIRILDPNAGRI